MAHPDKREDCRYELDFYCHFEEEPWQMLGEQFIAWLVESEQCLLGLPDLESSCSYECDDDDDIFCVEKLCCISYPPGVCDVPLVVTVEKNDCSGERCILSGS